MTRTNGSGSVLATLVTLIVAGSLLPACGGGSTAMRFQPFPGDRDVRGRRVESLARDYENTFPCAPGDVIDIRGLASHVYSAQGCSGRRDYILECRPGGYGQICSWQAIADLAGQAAVDMNCTPEAIEYEDVGPSVRRVSGCGYQAMYQLQCGGGGCGWIASSRIEQVGPVQQGGGGAYTY